MDLFPYRAGMRLSRTIAVVAGAAALFAIAGCGSVSERELDFNSTEEVRISEILVVSGSGNVTVRTSARSNVEIDRTVKYRGGEPDRTYRLDGTTLRIETGCGQWCSASYEIDAPEGVAIRGENGSGNVDLTGVAEVDLKVGSGSITVTGATGSVKVETGSGDIKVSDPGAAFTAKAGSGSVTGTGLGAGPVSVEGNSGDVALTLVQQVGVRAHAESGNVTVTTPAGSYRVTTDTGSGKATIEVVNDPQAATHFDLKTGSGDITVKPA
ncbi:hypothetical protein GCM10009779_47650 [Polymorphospora rubra]|uniref:DUF4097 domain-containing protein n=2 Tax=Polymorphospora rubra TaxID=338584 RepID=A0A810MTF1_9ACTN|nr:hypothetical protein Prubr_08010 [Polymorphospora rubra]